MIPLLFILIAAIAYALGAVNTYQLLSRFIFSKDLRKIGNKKISRANFVRAFGNQWGYIAIAVDVIKAAIAVLAGGLLMLIVNQDGTYTVIGRLFAGFCMTLGSIYPIHHQFRGTKGVAACITALWLSDWRVGLVVTAVFIGVVAFSQYVSLAGMCACAMGAVAMWLFIATENMRGTCGTLALFMALAVIWRQRGSIIRILNKREPKVKWGRAQTDRRMKDDF